MNDSVKFIFKTLLRVPIIILVTYFIFNIFAFSFTYFRLLGLSYVVMQTAVENNFIPTEEADTLLNYIDSLETRLLTDLDIGCATGEEDIGDQHLSIRSGSPTSGLNKKVQYGTPITVRVYGNYTWIFPLVNTGTDEEVEVGGAEIDRGNVMGLTYNETDHNILIEYKVPGLKYYPDLS